ncbi:diadenylate cyclase [Desulfosediminicola flagellatus]|uniref:diadenylate cyclase n=1 Tax=Desulfosediminicola flagellatus TaxID=2569541 RepID=UPI0010AD2D7F|nr:diadenylate cyclase [Desulfosediminicola flagellatus]
MKSIQLYTDIFLSWQTLLDIALITAGLFFLYHTFLRLGTWKIIVGMLAAFVLFIIASLLNLEGIEWIYKNVSHVALLALIVIFQPELRKIFEKVVSITVSRKKSQASQTTTIIADSLWMLAQQKRGAILVFPGKEHIQDKISGGYTLNASASMPLIMSIFDPNSPGHDGAVIIIDNLLASFGVRLPMSKSNRLSEEFGTRHHAAMGMAEESDALVLLVSEERGWVSAFVNGKMTRLNSPDDIILVIEKHFSKSGILDFARNTTFNRRTILQASCCLLMAIVFWSTLILGQKQMVERTLKIPIEYTSHAEGLVLIGNRVNELVVHVMGPKSALTDFVLSEPNAQVNLSKMSEGSHTLLITNENVKHPKNITVLDITPAEVELNLSAIVQKTVPIVPQLIGQLPEGLKIKKIQISPPDLQIFSPPVRADNKALTVSTTPIYLGSIHSDSRILCKIIAPPSFQPVDKRWPDVEVLISLEQ